MDTATLKTPFAKLQAAARKDPKKAGVLGVLCGVMGNIMATEAIKVLLGIGETLSGRLLIYDALEMGFTELKIRRDPDCPACGPNARLEFRDYDAWCSGVGAHTAAAVARA